MPLFGKKKESQPPAVVKVQPVASGVLAEEPKKSPVANEPADSAVKRVEDISREERPVFAPLFVKIDRYRQILNNIGQLRGAMIMIKNSLVTLNELEKARDETFHLIKGALEKVDQKIGVLDNEMIRPAGYHQESSAEDQTKTAYQDVETVEATIADLKGQIEELKTELTRMV